MNGGAEDYEPKQVAEKPGLSLLVAQFQSGSVRRDEFWQGLQMFVGGGELSPAERRRVFWDAHTRAGRIALRDLSVCFNPHVRVAPKHARSARGDAQLDRRLGRLLQLAPVLQQREQWRDRSGRWYRGCGLVTAAIGLVAVFADDFAQTSGRGRATALFMRFVLLGQLAVTFAFFAVARFLTYRYACVQQACERLQTEPACPV